jgi:hypothetical protein
MLDSTLDICPTAPTPATGSEVEFVSNNTYPGGTDRLNSATSLSDPEKLVIKHSVSGSEKGGNLVDRHLVSFSRVERDEDGKAHQCTVNVTIAVPRNGLFSTAEVTRQLALASNFLHTSGITAAILQNQS